MSCRKTMPTDQMNQFKLKYVERCIQEDQDLIDLINERIARAMLVQKELQGTSE